MRAATSKTCKVCGGPLVERRLDGVPLYVHDNSAGWYAGRQIDHDPEVDGQWPQEWSE